MDSVLLAYFVTAKKKAAVVDLGAGCGIITRLLAQRGVHGPFTAVELNAEAAACCRVNLADLNATVLAHDLRQPHPLLSAHAFDLVVSNPPFHLPGRGRMSPQSAKSLARHQTEFTLDDLWGVAGKLLSAKGRLALCLSTRWLDLALTGINRHGLFIKRLRMVHGRVELPAKIALLEIIKAGGPELKVEPPLIIYTDRHNTLHPEVADLYAQI